MRIFLPLLFLFSTSVFINNLHSQCTDAESGVLTINPPIPTDGSNYPGGTVVNMCFTLSEFNTPSVNWLHSIIPSFGPGFDFSSFNVVSVPNSCSGAGSWGWSTGWSSCAIGQAWGPGFVFESSQGVGCGGSPNDNNPGNNYGDGGTLCANRTWCWELTTVPVSSFSCATLNYNTQINVYGDAETGSWVPGGGPPCINDEPLCVPGLQNIMITQDITPCGCTNISATWDGQLLGQNCGLDIQWTGPGGFSSSELQNEVCSGGIYTLSIGVNDCVGYELTENITVNGNQLTVNLSANSSPVCVGDMITFNASNLGPGATYEWEINNQTLMGQSVTVVATGSGGERARFIGTDANGCTVEEELIYVVLPLPNAIIQLDNDMLCENETLEVRGIAPGTTAWDFDGATVNSGTGNGPYQLSFPGPGVYTIAYSADNGTCADTSYRDVTVFELYETPTVNCTVIGNDSIYFEWNSSGETASYELTVNGGTSFIVTDTFYGAGQLANGATIMLEVVPVDNGVCQNPAGGSASCTVFNCPDATLDIVQMDSIWCVDTSATNIELTFTGADLGTLTDTSWVGTAVTANSFDPIAAGAGVHEIILTVTNDENCAYSDTIVFEILPLPLSDFTLEDTICVLNNATATYTGGNDLSTTTFTWDFGGAVATALGNETYELAFPAPGDYTVRLTTEADICEGYEVIRNIHVLDIPATPAPGCGGGDIDSVSFNWPDVAGATAYTISINNGPPTTITETSVGVGGLAEGEIVSLNIFALGDGSCGNSMDTTITCIAEACPALTLLIDDSNSDFCLGQDPEFIVLGIAQNSGSGTGTYSWSGPGVSNDTFYVANAGLGSHEIIVEYTEGSCTYGDTTAFNVNAVPVADFSLSDSLVCVDEMITVTNEVAIIPGATYEWTFTGATPATATGFGPHVISYPASGAYMVDLTVTSNGCSSSFSREVIVEDALTAPTVSCTTPGQLEVIAFEWTAVAPTTGYEVTIGGVVVDTLAALTYTLNGLSPDTTVAITVRALGDGPCGDGPASATVNCSTLPCPSITLTPSAAQTAFCIADADSPVTLMATSSGGDMTGTFTWSGQGVAMNGTSFEFDPVVAGVGTHTLTVDYVETAGCTGQATLQMDVFATPDASFTISDDDICQTATTTVTYTGATGPNVTIDWDFGVAAVSDQGGEVYELGWPAAGTYAISLTVSENGCDSIVVDSVTVTEPLGAVDVSCTDRTLTSVTFGWDAVAGALGYIIDLNGTLDTITELSVLVSDLSPEEMVSITVTPLGVDPCGNGIADTEACAALACPAITVSPTAAQTAFCLDGNPVSTTLSATSSGGDMTGTFTWSGAGVTDDGTNATFDPAVAGIGTHVIIADYVETAGCSGRDSIIMNVFAVPTADFTLAPTPFCSNSVTTVTYTGTATANATYTWDFDGATTTDLGNETYELNWPTAGTYTVSLIVSEAGCTDTLSMEATVAEPLETPVPSCGTPTTTSVQFEWPAVEGADGYMISIDGETAFEIDSTNFMVSGLGENTSVSLTIFATGPAPCGNSESVTISCSSAPCPDVTVEPSAVQTDFCAGIDNASVVLSANVIGGGNGTISWTGAGVVNVGDDFFFSPEGLLPGTYPLTVTYTETVCSYEATLEMVVNAQPSAVFAIASSSVCATNAVMVNLTTAPIDGAEYSWDFDSATVTDLGGEAYMLRWATAGDREISLTANASGCISAHSAALTVTSIPNAGQRIQDAAVCQNSGEMLSLGDLISGADEGGIWSAGPGAPATIDVATGRLNTANMAAGTFEYVYTVSGGVCDDSSVSVFVQVEPAPVASAGANQTLTCTMGMVSLNGSGSTASGNLTYLWTGPDGNPIMTDADQPIVDVAAPGTYTLTVTSELGCSASASVTVDSETEVPVPQVEINNISCFSADDGTIQVTAVDGGVPPYLYSLNGAAPVNSSFFTGLEQGEYSLRVTDANGCFTELFLGLDRPDELSVSITLPDDQTDYNEGDQVTMTANITGGNVIDTLIWMPDSLGRSGEGLSNTITFIADQTRTVMVTVVDENGCRASDQTTILVRKERPIFIPSGFSPNGDNVNDVFFIGADPLKVEEIEEFLVFNRWGESIFENYNFQPNDPVEGWNGTHREEPLNPAVFVYVAKVRFKTGEVTVFKGDVTLIR